MSDELILVQNLIHEIRGQKVMLDSDLARLYQVETKVLNQAVRRNIKRFPEDFMFQLDNKEFANLKSQIVTSSWGGRRTPPLAFTEEGIAMLSSVLHSDIAIAANISILRAFVKVREYLLMASTVSAEVKETGYSEPEELTEFEQRIMRLVNRSTFQRRTVDEDGARYVAGLLLPYAKKQLEQQKSK